MSTLNIESLLQDLEADIGLTKAASVAQDDKPALSAELEGLLVKQASIDTAGQAGKTLAKSILEKMANEVNTANAEMVAQDNAKIVPTVEAPTDTITDIMDNLIDHAIATGAQPIDTAAARADEIKDKQEGTPEMAKEAELIEKIAQAVIEKLAGVEDLAPAANQIQADTAQMVAQQDAIIQPTPGGEGTLNQILDAIVADAKAKGAISYDTAATGESAAAAEEQDEQVEKAAAVSALVEAGVGFEDAVDMVKQAEVEIWAEEEGLAKQAALDELMTEGLDFDSALDLIKEASDAGFFSVGIEKEAATLEGELIPAGGRMVANVAQPEAAAGPSMMGRLKGVLGTRAGKIGGAIAALGTAAALGRASKSQTKQAALDELMAEGMDFDAAVDLIKEAAALEGEYIPAGGGRVAKIADPSMMSKLKGILGTRAGKIGGAVAALGAAAALGRASKSQTKQAALDELMAEGVSFEDAVDLIKEASV